ncbi:MAG TPA: hypothetical protein VK716_14910 [Terracidiphilus sp.]|jgi:hypothetical protein|nr:hypothetical protein [Terracidiphilus sp.]
MSDENNTEQISSTDREVADRAALRRNELFQLPGLLAIGLYLLLLAGVLILGVVGRHYPPLLLLLAAAFMTASAGLVLLLRWAWAGALAAVFLLSCYNMWIFSEQRAGSALIQGLLNLVFFLYLVRSEVRSRLR